MPYSKRSIRDSYFDTNIAIFDYFLCDAIDVMKCRRMQSYAIFGHFMASYDMT